MTQIFYLQASASYPTACHKNHPPKIATVTNQKAQKRHSPPSLVLNEKKTEAMTYLRRDVAKVYGNEFRTLFDTTMMSQSAIETIHWIDGSVEVVKPTSLENQDRHPKEMFSREMISNIKEFQTQHNILYRPIHPLKC